MIPIWNEVIEEGIAFPQEDFLNRETAPDFFAEQSYCGVAADDSGRILGLYILHPNNVDVYKRQSISAAESVEMR